MHQKDTCHTIARLQRSTSSQYSSPFQAQASLCSGSRGEGGAAQHETGGPHQAAHQGAQERPGRPRERAETQKSSKRHYQGEYLLYMMT